jgi:hypothetical protein
MCAALVYDRQRWANVVGQPRAGAPTGLQHPHTACMQRPPAAAAGRSSSPLTDKQILTLLLSGSPNSSWLASGQIASGSGLSASSMASRNLRSGSHEAISSTAALYGCTACCGVPGLAWHRGRSTEEPLGDLPTQSAASQFGSRAVSSPAKFSCTIS